MPDRIPAEPDTSHPRTAPRGGRILAGTSGFAYPGWAPRFYPHGLPARRYLGHYAGRLPAVELNNTFYARPTVDRIRGWVSAVPSSFRFVVKAQRGSAVRALAGDGAGRAGPTGLADAGPAGAGRSGAARPLPVVDRPGAVNGAVDPGAGPGPSGRTTGERGGSGVDGAVGWLTEPLPAFGSTLGAVLFRVPDAIARDDDGLDDLLRSWPGAVPLVLELQHPSWHVDETFAALRAAGAVLCATDLDAMDTPPDIRRTGPFLYVRLRRAAYPDASLDDWARRLVPFLDDGLDAYVIFRHDADGATAGLAEDFAARVERIREAG